MTFMAVFTAVDALTLGLAVRVLLGGRRQPVAVSPSSDETRVAELVARTDGIGFCKVDAVSAPDPAVGVGPVRGLRQGERGLEEGDVLRLDEIRQDYLAEVSHELKTPVGAVALLARRCWALRRTRVRCAGSAARSCTRQTGWVLW
jgi:signal transduction histidine kinase